MSGHEGGLLDDCWTIAGRLLDKCDLRHRRLLDMLDASSNLLAKTRKPSTCGKHKTAGQRHIYLSTYLPCVRGLAQRLLDTSSMSSNLEAKMTQPAPYSALPGIEPSTTRERCRCNAPIIGTYDDPDALGLPVTINREPTTPTAALAAIVNGRTVVYASRFKRERGAGVATDFRYWRPAQYAVNFTKPLHVEHVCGETYPPAEPDDTVTRMWPDATTPPPF